MSRRDTSRAAVLVVLILGLSLMASFSLRQAINNALGGTETGSSIDLHSYWAPAQDLLEGSSPYVKAGPDASEPQSDELASFPRNPANAPLMLLVLAPLGLLDWSDATVVWAAINIFLALLVPYMLYRLARPAVPRLSLLVLTLVFLTMLPTRNVVSNGQTSLLVMAAAVATVMGIKANRWALSGAFLALALAKFSLTGLIAVWFAMAGYWIPLLMAGALHLAAVIAISLVSGAPVITIVQQYWQVAAAHGRIVGDVDLISFASRIGIGQTPAQVFAAIVLLLTVGVVARQLAIRGKMLQGAAPAARTGESLMLLAPLLLAALIAIYHRAYDVVALIVLGPKLAEVLLESRQDALAPTARLAALMVTSAIGVFLLPRAALVKFWPGWETIYPFLATGASVMAWIASLLLLTAYKPDAIGQRERGEQAVQPLRRRRQS